MSILSKLFGSSGQEPQPQEAPEIVATPTYSDDELLDLCWACSGGLGDGICGYHEEQWKREMKKRIPFSR